MIVKAVCVISTWPSHPTQLFIMQSFVYPALLLVFAGLSYSSLFSAVYIAVWCLSRSCILSKFIFLFQRLDQVAFFQVMTSLQIVCLPDLPKQFMQHLGQAGQISLDGILPSGPAHLPFLRYLVALLNFYFTWPVLIDLQRFERCVNWLMSGISLGTGRLSSSLKSSAHLVYFSSWSESTSSIGLDRSVCRIL